MNGAVPAAAPRSALARLALSLTRDKADTLLLLGAALLVLVPHAAHLPPWVTALCGATLFWRGLITFRGRRMPPMLLLMPIALAAMGGVYMTFRTLLGRDAGVAMLVLLVAFKMLEMHARRDLFVVIFLCFFLVLTNFFYSQSMFTGLLMVVSVIALLTAQLSFQYTGAVPPLGQRLRLGARIFGLAAPLALALFFLFPRIEGPLWGMPGDAGSGRSGLSNSMAPGNISNLAQSSEVAFRVKFDGAPPEQAQLYWRALVLADFDGRNWTQLKRNYLMPVTPAEVEAQGKPVSYQVTMEPHGNRWLFALDVLQAVPELPGNNARLSGQHELVAAVPVGSRLRYDAVSHVRYRLDAGAGARLVNSEPWLALPRGFNPRAMQAGLDLQRHAAPVDRVRAVLDSFARGGYVYTLEPPLLGRDTVDEFLYNSKAGFCEHYASAFVFLMRAADVPARVVTGYQGGEMNPVDGFMTVRQSDAHAWAEVWLAGRGWVRIDPTGAVAPDRIASNLAGALAPPPLFGLDSVGSLIKGARESSLMAQLRNHMSAINNGWNQWALNYTPERQRDVLDNLSLAFGNGRTLFAVAALLGIVFLARAFRSRGEKDPIDALYSALCQRLGQLGQARTIDEGPAAYALRLSATSLAQEKKHAIARFLQLYSAHKYGRPAADPALAATLKSLLKNI